MREFHEFLFDKIETQSRFFKLDTVVNFETDNKQKGMVLFLNDDLSLFRRLRFHIAKEERLITFSLFSGDEEYFRKQPDWTIAIETDYDGFSSTQTLKLFEALKEIFINEAL